MITTKKFCLTSVTTQDLAPLEILFPKGWLDSWTDLARCLYVALIKFEGLDIPRETLAKVAIAQVLTLAEKMGGQPRYIPIADDSPAGFLRRVVCREFDGDNYAELAARCGVKEADIQEIVNSKTFSRRQKKLHQTTALAASLGFDSVPLEALFPRGWVEAWTDFACVFYGALINDDEHVLSNETLAMVAIDQVFSLAQQMGGRNVYISRGDKFKQGCIKDEILHTFNGSNYRELASKHGLSETRIRQIVSGYVTPKQQKAVTLSPTSSTLKATP